MINTADLYALTAARAMRAFSRQYGGSCVSILSIPNASLLSASAVDLTANNH